MFGHKIILGESIGRHTLRTVVLGQVVLVPDEVSQMRELFQEGCSDLLLLSADVCRYTLVDHIEGVVHRHIGHLLKDQIVLDDHGHRTYRPEMHDTVLRRPHACRLEGEGVHRYGEHDQIEALRYFSNDGCSTRTGAPVP